MMQCPECGSKNMRATHAFSAGERGMTRCRKCESCGAKYTTVELVLSRYLGRNHGYGTAAKLLREGKLEIRRVEPNE